MEGRRYWQGGLRTSPTLVLYNYVIQCSRQPVLQSIYLSVYILSIPCHYVIGQIAQRGRSIYTPYIGNSPGLLCVYSIVKIFDSAVHYLHKQCKQYEISGYCHQMVAQNTLRTCRVSNFDLFKTFLQFKSSFKFKMYAKK